MQKEIDLTSSGTPVRPVTSQGTWQALAERVGGSTLILAALFLLLILALNADLFRKPIIEDGDFAADSLTVQQAKHLHLLVGHYSRWQIHHPGPAYWYLFGLGEFLFYDLLHLVPAPFNAQLVTVIILNVGLLFAAFAIFKRHCPQFSIPLAMAITIVITVLVNSIATPSMLISVWQPDLLLFAYLLFAVSGASVLGGQTRDLPWMALSGMLLIHIHLSQPLFVGLIGGGVIACLLVPAARQGRLRAFVIERRWHFALAAALCLILALPPLLDIVLHTPSNLDDIRGYLHAHAGERNGLLTSFRYVLCFFLFVPKPEQVLTDPSGSVLREALSRPWVIIYWLVFFVSSLLAMALVRIDAGRSRSAFPRHLLWITAATVILFFYWAIRITGPLFLYNGNFFFFVHLVGWFLLLSVFSRRWVNQKGALAFASIGFTIAFAFINRDVLRSSAPSNPDVLQAAIAVSGAGLGDPKLTFQHDDWPLAAGVANAMERQGKPFCVSPDWGFMFTRENVCPDELRTERVAIATLGAPCMPPCRELYRSKTMSVTFSPVEWLKVPVSIGLADTADIKTGFYASEGTHRWAQKHAVIRFLLAPELPQAACFQLRLTGFGYPGRPTQVFLNGHRLGTLSKATLDTAAFAVSRDNLKAGDVNEVSLETERAGPVGADPREIGYGFNNLTLLSDPAEASCEMGSGPEYASLPVDWKAGCYGPEGPPSNEWRWCGSESALVIHNPYPEPRRVTVRADLSTGHAEPAPVVIRSRISSDRLAVNSIPRTYVSTLVLLPGENSLDFSCRAPRAEAPKDPRTMVLRFDHFSVESDGKALPTDADRSLASPLLIPGAGFYGLEASGDDTWRWCQRKCELILDNDTARPIVALFDATLITGQKEMSTVTLGSGIFAKTYRVNLDGLHARERFIAPPGRYTLAFSTDAPPVAAPGDPRLLVLQVKNLRVGIADPE